MFTLNFEYLCTHKSKYAEEKDTEHFTLEEIDFTLTLKDTFNILKSKNKSQNFKEANIYYFIYLGKICDINDTLKNLNIKDNGTIMVLNKEINNKKNMALSSLLNLFNSVNSIDLQETVNTNLLNFYDNGLINQPIQDTIVNYVIEEEDYEIYKTQLETLKLMGFTEEETNIHALKRNGGNINLAIEWIVGLD